jgi:crotonobetainyl-CoA:carnitine CoA-transferase CaiB-like acyl-CoA transferase
VAGPFDSPDVQEVVATADLIVDGLLPGPEDDEVESTRSPVSVRVSITPYGRTGPYAGRPATEFEIVELASALRIPVAPVNSGRTVLEDGHLQARGAFVSSPDGDFVHPRPPYLFDGQPLLPRSPAPRFGEHNGAIPARPARTIASAAGASTAPALPLAGIRILDCTAWWAGPSSTVVLAALGADVIHVESMARLDAARTAGSAWLGRDLQWWEGSCMFIAGNTNKRGITLDLSTPAGREATVKLVKGADAVVENFSPGSSTTSAWPAKRCGRSIPGRCSSACRRSDSAGRGGTTSVSPRPWNK